MRPIRLSLLALMIATGCDSPSDSAGGARPARMDVVSGDLQPTAVVGTALSEPLVVRVVNANGKPLRGQLVNFRVASGGGAVFAGAAQTNENGEARERWTLGTVAGDTQRVEARAVDPTTGEAQVFAVFRAIGTPDAPATLLPVGPQRAGTVGSELADSLAVKLADRYGNVVPNATVTWSVKRGGGSVSPAQSRSDAAGIARSRWVLGTRADSTHVAAAAVSATLQAEFTATASIEGAVTASAVAGGGQRATVLGSPAEPLRVVVRTADGRPVAGAPVRWTGAGLESAVVDTVTNANGEASARVTLGREAREYRVVAQAGTGPAAEFVLYGTPDAPSTLTPWYSGTLGGAISSLLDDSIGVVVRDRHGNVVPGVAVDWSAAAGGGSLAPGASVTDAAGLAWTRWTLGATPGGQRARATARGTAVAVEIPANAGTELRIVAGSDILSLDGAVWEQPRVALYGPNGAIGDARVEWTVTSGGGSVSPAASRSSLGNPGGSAATAWTLGGTAGTHRLTARVGGLTATLTARRPAAGSLQLLGTPGGSVLDTDGVRVLVVDPAENTRTLRIRRVTGGGDTVVASGDSPRPVYGVLADGAVLVIMEAASGARTLREWRDGNSVELGPVRTLVANGPWVAWTWPTPYGNIGMTRRNVRTGRTDSLEESYFTGIEDLSETGAVAFTRDLEGRQSVIWTTFGIFPVSGGPGWTRVDGDTAYWTYGDAPNPTRFTLFSRPLPSRTSTTRYRGPDQQRPQFAVEEGWLAIREEGTRVAHFTRVSPSGEVLRLGGVRIAEPLVFTTEAEAVSRTGTAAFLFRGDGVLRILVAPGSGAEPYVAPAPGGARIVERNGRVYVLTPTSVYVVD
jgi:hypothetical protein